jgi:hypothetical protein
LLDRIDIHIEVPQVEYEKLSDDRLGEPSAAIQARVEAARERQRFGNGSGMLANADMGPAAYQIHGSIKDWIMVVGLCPLANMLLGCLAISIYAVSHKGKE